LIDSTHNPTLVGRRCAQRRHVTWACVNQDFETITALATTCSCWPGSSTPVVWQTELSQCRSTTGLWMRCSRWTVYTATTKNRVLLATSSLTLQRSSTVTYSQC